MRPLVIGLLLTISTATFAEIYKYTDENGNTVFTNEPPAHVEAKPVDLPPPTIIEMRAPQPSGISAADDVSAQSTDGQAYRVLTITGLPENDPVRANSGMIEVSAQLLPPLKQGHLLRFVLDGEPAAPASASTTLQLTNVSRGKHNLLVEVLDGDKVIQRSAQETFHVQRVHTSSPALKPKPTP